MQTTRQFLSVAFFTLLSSLSLSSATHAQSAADPFARDVVQITKWFEGVFDNDSQIWFEEDRRWQGKEEDKHRRNNAKHIPLELDAIGEHVFYVEEYMDNDPTNVWRQRIVSFESAPPKGIRMKIYFIKDAEELLGLEATSLKQIVKVENLTNLPECDVWFLRDGDQFSGKMDYQKCAFGEGDKKRYSEHNMLISERKYWRIDKTWLFSTGAMHAGEKSSEPSKMRKADLYDCKISMPYVSYAEPNEKDVSLDGLVVHDQGGSAKFTDPRSNQEFELQLREKEYPYYKQGSDFFLMRLKQVGAKYSAALVTTAPDPERLSVNIGTMSASCKLSD